LSGTLSIEGDDTMQDRLGVQRWAPALFALFFAAIVGYWAYNMGLAHGIAEQLPPAAAGVPPWPYYYHRPWGFGPLFPLLFLGFWLFVLRFAVRGGRRRGGWGGYHGDGTHDVPPMFEEWHRRAHQRDAQAAPGAKG
jgi:hypothetical protein